MFTKKNIFLSVVIFLFTLIISSYFARIGVDAHHDGIMFKAALDVAEGKTLYTQTYAHYGPISPLVQAFSILLFGRYVFSIRLITVIFYAFTAVVLFFVWSKFLSKKLSFVSVLLFICLLPFFSQIFYPWSSVYGLFFLSVTLLLFINSITNKSVFKLNYLFLMGVTSALSFNSKQTFLLLSISMLVFFVLLFSLKIIKRSQAIRYVSYFLSGFLLVTAVLVAWLLANGALIDYFKQTIWLGYIEGRIIGKGENLFTILNILIKSPIWLLLPITSIYIAIRSIIRIKQTKTQFDISLLGISLICLASILQYYPLLDYSHIFWAAAPSLGLFIYFLFTVLPQDLKKIKHKKLLILFILVISLFSLSKEVIQNVSGGIHKATKHYVVIQTPTVLKTMLLTKEEASYYESIATNMDNYLKKHQDKHFVINISSAIYMTFTERAVNMKPMFLNSSGYTSGIYPYEKQFYAYVKENKPLMMVPIETEKDFPDYKRVMELPASTQSVFLEPIE